jgi:hypothetical protein
VRPRPARLDLVEDEERAVAAAQRAGVREIAGRSYRQKLWMREKGDVPFWGS